MTSNRVTGPSSSEPSKGQQDKLQSQQHRKVEKVEKVREVDEVENEQTRKKFRQFMDDEEPPAPRAPSPFETNFYFASTKETTSTGELGEEDGAVTAPSADLGDMDETAVPSPFYAPPPNVEAAPPSVGDEEDDLPRSGQFWDTVDAPPDQPPQGNRFQETSQSAQRPHAPPSGKDKKKDKALFVGAEEGKAGAKKKTSPGMPQPPHMNESPFGPPGKPIAKPSAKEGKESKRDLEKEGPVVSRFEASEKEGTSQRAKRGEDARGMAPREELFPIERRPSKKQSEKEEEGTPKKEVRDEEAPTARYVRREEEEKKVVSPFSVPEKEKKERIGPIQKETEKKERIEPVRKEKEASPFLPPTKKEEKKEKSSQERQTPLARDEGMIAPPPPYQMEEREGRRGKGKEEEGIQIEPPSLPPLPANIAPIAQTAATEAAPYLSPEVLPLFYQMVGTIYVMKAADVSRTEIVLNAPSFANSKFFGATITIEKYATAPDALNIRLTGTNEAVTAFNQNLPSLYAAFEHRNFNFRIGRIDAVYSIERPVFRRKEKGESRGEFGGDFQDRSK